MELQQMTDKTISMLRTGILVLAVALVALSGLTVWRIMTQDPTTPRSELDRAVLTDEQAVKADPEDPAARIKLAAAYVERGNTAAAIEQAKIAIRLAPQDPSGYYVLGLAQVKARDFDQGIANLQKAASTEGQLAPFYQDVWLALARVYQRQDRLEDALRAMSKALSYGPENALLLYERGRLNEQAKRWMDAMDDYAAALEYLPQYQEARERFEALKKAHPAEYEKLRKLYEATSTAEPATSTP
jgi:tetratricopeptide (TPR) repeat protein